MSRAAARGGAVILAHPHAEGGKAVLRREFSEQSKMTRRIAVARRQNHQPFWREVEGAQTGEKCAGFFRRNARFLRFAAGIDLDEKHRHRPAGFADGFEESFSEAQPVKSVNRRKQAERGFGFIALQPAYHMEFNIGEAGEQNRPFLRRFLNAVLAEYPPALLQQSQQARGGTGFAHRDNHRPRRRHFGGDLAAAAAGSLRGDG